MVFRGKPSKACARCRARRAKCDLRSDACGQCLRASVPCFGYRDTQQLRIRDESQSVEMKMLRRGVLLEPQYLPLSIDLQARAAFFDYYITLKCWNFLEPYHHPMDCPEHLTLAIEAVSLAYLWYQVYSDAALANARESYISALRVTKKTLKSSKEACKVTSLLTALLLDLFEKITDSEPRNNKAWTSHVDGALALVTLRGLEKFQRPSEFSILVRLIGNYITSSIASGSPIPDELNAIQAYVNKHLDIQDPKLRLSELMIEYANINSDLRRGALSNDVYIKLARELDRKTRALDLELPSRWQYLTKYLQDKSNRTFELHIDIYSDPRVCQARNLLRIMRLLVNESLIECCIASPGAETHLELTAIARDNIEMLASEICASVPQYLDCDGAARQKFSSISQRPNGISDSDHLHTHSHQLDCYTLIFPLYVAGRSKAVPGMESWAIQQLHYISSHFHIRNAEVVAQILERGNDVSPWEVYAILGSYAFQA